MTKEEREAIRERSKTALEIWRSRPETGLPGEISTVTVALCNIPALLDALEAAEKRAEALERAIKKNADACCFSCKSFEQCIAYGKTTACTLAGWNPSAWQFDQARFEGKEKNNEKNSH